MNVHRNLLIVGVLFLLVVITGGVIFFGGGGSTEGELDLSVRRAGPAPAETEPTIFHQGDRTVLLLDFIVQNHTANDAEISVFYLSPTVFPDGMIGEPLNDTTEELAGVGNLDLFGDSVLLGRSVILPPGSPSPEYPGSVNSYAEFSIPVSPGIVIPGNSQKKLKLVFNSEINPTLASRVLFGTSLHTVRAHDPGAPDHVRTVVNLSEDAADPGGLLSSINSIWAPKLWTLRSPYIHIDP